MGFSERTRLIENCKVMHCFSRIVDFHSTYAPLSKRNLNLDPNFGNKDQSSRLTILACDFGPARAVDFSPFRDAGRSVISLIITGMACVALAAMVPANN